jgi:hypothetical protein
MTANSDSLNRHHERTVDAMTVTLREAKGLFQLYVYFILPSHHVDVHDLG